MGRKSTPGLTKVTFMTTGIFLMRLVNNPKSLRNYTHIIMDEVHERDLDIDFSLVVVKHLLGRQDAEDGLKFKLILMSATFNTQLFANYFSKSSVQTIEQVNAYEGTQAIYDKEEAQRKLREEAGWGPSKPSDWDTKPNLMEDEDEWVEKKPQAYLEMAVKKT